MSSLESLRAGIPEAAKDLKLNLGAVLTPGHLSEAQVWGVAVACAIAARNPQLRSAIIEDALTKVGEPVVEDAKAAAALMGMNNIYYRFRHIIGKPEYAEKPAKLRMLRLANVLTNKTDFELMCLAVSAINGCEACVRSHEKVVIEGGMTEDHVNDAVRIASVIHGTAVALEM